MKIKEITSQNRRDIYGILVCQHCGHEQKFTGYDDHFWRNERVPTINCHSCRKTGRDALPVEPKYPKDQVV